VSQARGPSVHKAWSYEDGKEKKASKGGILGGRVVRHEEEARDSASNPNFLKR